MWHLFCTIRYIYIYIYKKTLIEYLFKKSEGNRSRYQILSVTTMIRWLNPMSEMSAKRLFTLWLISSYDHWCFSKVRMDSDASSPCQPHHSAKRGMLAFLFRLYAIGKLTGLKVFLFPISKPWINMGLVLT